MTSSGIPDYWLSRPAIDLDETARAVFDRVLADALAVGGSPVIHLDASWPKWQFLCHIADSHDVVLHGSGDPDIALFEPRQSPDLNQFGNQKAVYGASDGIWAMFYAVVDRNRYPMSVNNSCFRVSANGTTFGPFYFFSITREALRVEPWRSGTVYLLPRESFIEEAPMALGIGEVRSAQLASVRPVRPVARLTVAPADFPFLDRVRGHDDRRLQEYATALQTGGPLPDGD